MRIKGLKEVALAVSLLAAPAMTVAAQDQAKPDNTKINKRDAHSTEPTADNQKDNTSDREVSRKIRRAVVQDKALSTYAHNIKIIAQHGKVTLKGPVHSEDEKRAIEEKAVAVVGKENVTNEISVTGDADRSKK
jgi:hyperosmotically inducible protein